MIFNKNMLRLYAITDRRYNDKFTLYEQVEQALAGGATIVQLREKELEEVAFAKEASIIKRLCHQYGVPLIINDFIIGATAKTVSQAQTAQRLGADYLGVGAVFPSSTKSDAVRITKEQLKEISKSVTIPIVAIGGITLENAHTLNDSGTSGIAVVSSLFGAENIKKAAEDLRKTSETIIQ